MRKIERYKAKDGTVTFRVRFRINGESTSITFRGPEAEAKKNATEFAGILSALGPAGALEWQRKNELEHSDANSITLNEWAEHYIATRTRITEGTRHGYRRAYALSYGPLIGNKPVTAITRTHVAEALNHLATKGGRNGTGYSDKTLANAHLLLASMFKEAVEDELIRKSPTKGIHVPRGTDHQSVEMQLLTEADFVTLLNGIPVHYRPLVVTLFGTGIRWGEAEALEVRDVNFTAKTLRINKAAKWNTSKAQRDVGPTKTKRSNRVVPIDDILIAWLLPLTQGRAKSARLFTAPRGGPLRHKSFWQEAWVPACEKAGLVDPRPRIHDARHTHASWLIADNVNMVTIQRRLGHEKITTTIDTYGHLSAESQREAADAAGRVFSSVFRAAAIGSAGELTEAAGDA
jgi:integrase